MTPDDLRNRLRTLDLSDEVRAFILELFEGAGRKVGTWSISARGAPSARTLGTRDRPRLTPRCSPRRLRAIVSGFTLPMHHLDCALTECRELLL